LKGLLKARCQQTDWVGPRPRAGWIQLSSASRKPQCRSICRNADIVPGTWRKGLTGPLNRRY